MCFKWKKTFVVLECPNFTEVKQKWKSDSIVICKKPQALLPLIH